MVLLDRRGVDIPISEEVVKAAAENWDSGKDDRKYVHGAIHAQSYR